MAEYKKQTDEVHIITLESKITHALWGSKIAPIGEKVNLEVWTQFVGSGSDIQIKIQDKRGKKIDKLKGKVYGNYFADSIVISDKAKEFLVFTAKLPKHGLEAKSGVLQIVPPIKVTDMKWGQNEARRGDIVKLSADIEGIPDETEVIIRIYEYDQDGAHDFITKFPCQVKNKKIEAEWEYEYHEDTDEIPTQEEKEKYGKNYNPPEYFFVIDFHGQRFGDKQASGLLKFQDNIEILLTNGLNKPLADEPYILYLPDDQEIKGKTDAEGLIKLDDIPPGKVYVEFEQLFEVTPVVENELPSSNMESATTVEVQTKASTTPHTETSILSEASEESDEADIYDNSDKADEFDEDQVDDTDATSDEEETEIVLKENEETFSGEIPIDIPLYLTGSHCHFAIFQCVSAVLVDELDKPLAELDYSIIDSEGATVAHGKTNDNGTIIKDMLPSEMYTIETRLGKFDIASTSSVYDPEIITLNRSQEGEDGQ